MLNLSQHAAIALLVDADNISSWNAVGQIFGQFQLPSRVKVKRAYGDWFANQLKGWKTFLSEHEIEPIHSLPTPTSGKNATDIRLVIDAMDLLYSQAIDCFVIVSGDRDFAPLVRRLKQAEKTVIGFGKKNSAALLKNAYHQFIAIEELNALSSSSQPQLHVISGTAPKSSQNTATTPDSKPAASTQNAQKSNQKSNQKSKTNKKSTQKTQTNSQTSSQTNSQAKVLPLAKELTEIAKLAYQEVSTANGWVTVEALEPHLKKICKQKLKEDFSCQLFGHKSLVKIVSAAGIFEWDANQPDSTKTKNKRLKLKKAA